MVLRLILSSVVLVGLPAAAALYAQTAAVAPALFQQLRETGGDEQRRPVRVDPGPVLAGTRRLRLDLPHGGAVVARRTQFRRNGPLGTTWQGEIVGMAGSTVLLSAQGGAIVGTIESERGEFLLLPDAAGMHRLVHQTDDPAHRCHTESLTGPVDLGTIRPRSDRAREGAVIDVLVIYAPRAPDVVGGDYFLRLTVMHYVEYTNQVLRNSGVDARVRLVDVVVNPLGEIYSNSTLDVISASGEVNALRDAAGADLLALVHNGPERCGRAFVLQSLGPNADRSGFATMALDCGARTFAHEIGHTLGLQHDPEASGTTLPVVAPGAYGYWIANVFRTVMATSTCRCSNIVQFSTPRLSFQGAPTGITGERDNASVAALTTPHVAAYRPSLFVFDDDFDSGDLDAWKRVRGQLDVVSLEPDNTGDALAIPLDLDTRRRFAMHRIRGQPDGIRIALALDLLEGTAGSTDVEFLRLVGRGGTSVSLVLQGGRRDHVALLAETTAGIVEVARLQVRSRFVELIALEWQRASSAGASDGRVALLNHGIVVGEVTNLPLGTRSPRQVRVGLPGGADGDGAGMLRVDDYRVIQLSGPVQAR